MLSLLLDAAWMTLGLALASLVGGMALALAFSAAELSKQRWLVWPVATLTTLIRGLPELLVVLFIYFGSTQVLFLITGEYVEFSPFACGVLALSLLFAWNRQYWLLVSLGVLLASLTATASPQLFALAREYADSRNKRADMFSSVLRAQFSLAWVIGPPAAFALAIGYGFEVMYLASALAYLICAFVVWRWLPSLPLPSSHGGGERVSSWRDPSVRALFIASTLMWTCNSMYLINMPLYITRELGLEEKLAGILMGTAAALEIPFMLLAGYYTRRFGKRPMMLLAVLAGVGFYVGLVTLSSQHALIALQLLNAIFIGIVAGIGMSYFQDLMPGRAGVATTLFANSIRTGSIMAGAIAGTVAEIWSFHGVFMVATALALAALGACWRVPNV